MDNRLVPRRRKGRSRALNLEASGYADLRQFGARTNKCSLEIYASNQPEEIKL
jgi:hypothetical protein